VFHADEWTGQDVSDNRDPGTGKNRVVLEDFGVLEESWKKNFFFLLACGIMMISDGTCLLG
jgi:hypothetical protein